MENITVIESVEGKFGRQLKDARGYLSFGKFFKGEMIYAPGTELECDIFTTGKGNRYINSLKVLSMAPSFPVVAVEAPKRGRKAVPPMAASVPAKKDVDWDAISRGKVRSLFVEALLGNPNVTQGVEALDMDKVKEMIEPLVSYVFGD